MSYELKLHTKHLKVPCIITAGVSFGDATTYTCDVRLQVCNITKKTRQKITQAAGGTTCVIFDVGSLQTHHGWSWSLGRNLYSFTAPPFASRLTQRVPSQHISYCNTTSPFSNTSEPHWWFSSRVIISSNIFPFPMENLSPLTKP